MKLLPVPYTEALEQDYLPAKLTNEDYPEPDPEGQHDRHGRDRLGAGGLQLAARHRSLPPRRAVHRRVLHQVPGVPEAAAPRQVEGDQPRRHLRGWKRFPGRRGVAGQERRHGRLPAPSPIDPHRARAGSQGRAQRPAEQERLFQQFMEWSRTQQQASRAATSAGAVGERGESSMSRPAQAKPERARAWRRACRAAAVAGASVAALHARSRSRPRRPASARRSRLRPPSATEAATQVAARRSRVGPPGAAAAAAASCAYADCRRWPRCPTAIRSHRARGPCR